MGSKSFLGTCFLFLVAFSLKTNAADFDIKKYGAKADGRTDDSQVMIFFYSFRNFAWYSSLIVIVSLYHIVNIVMYKQSDYITYAL